MAGHPQSSPRGLFGKAAIDLGYGSVGRIYANSTTIILPSTGLQMAALSSLKITSNSTGIKIGSRYISTNTTGNATT